MYTQKTNNSHYSCPVDQQEVEFECNCTDIECILSYIERLYEDESAFQMDHNELVRLSLMLLGFATMVRSHKYKLPDGTWVQDDGRFLIYALVKWHHIPFDVIVNIIRDLRRIIPTFGFHQPCQPEECPAMVAVLALIDEVDKLGDNWYAGSFEKWVFKTSTCV